MTFEERAAKKLAREQAKIEKARAAAEKEKQRLALNTQYGLTGDDRVLPELIPEEDKPWTNDLAEIGKQVVGGAVVDLPEMLGKAATAFSSDGSFADRMGKKLIASAKGREEYWKPNMEGRGKIAQALISGGRAVAPSVATMGVGLGAGALGAGALASTALGMGASTALFGGSQYQDTYDKLIAAGKTPEEAHIAALKTGAVQGGGEALANLAQMKLLGSGAKLVKGGIEGSLKEATKQNALKEFAKDYGTAMVAEPATEIAQDIGTEAVERNAGIAPQQSYGDIAYQSGTAALGMTTLLAPFGLHGHFQNEAKAKVTENALDNPKIAKEYRQNEVNKLRDIAKGQGVNKDEADDWHTQATAEIDAGKPVTRTAPPRVDTQAAEQEAQRQAAEQEAQRQAAEQEAQRQVAEQEAQRQAAEQEAQRQAAEQEAQRQAAEQEAQRQAAEQEAQRQAAEQEAQAAQSQQEADNLAARDAVVSSGHPSAQDIVGSLHLGTPEDTQTAVDQTVAPTEDTQTVAPTEDTQTVAPTEDTQTVAPTEDTQTVAPTEDTQTVAPTEGTQTVAPTEGTQTAVDQTAAPTGDTQTAVDQTATDGTQTAAGLQSQLEAKQQELASLKPLVWNTNPEILSNGLARHETNVVNRAAKEQTLNEEINALPEKLNASQKREATQILPSNSPQQGILGESGSAAISGEGVSTSTLQDVGESSQQEAPEESAIAPVDLTAAHEVAANAVNPPAKYRAAILEGLRNKITPDTQFDAKGNVLKPDGSIDTSITLGQARHAQQYHAVLVREAEKPQRMADAIDVVNRVRNGALDSTAPEVKQAAQGLSIDTAQLNAEQTIKAIDKATVVGRFKASKNIAEAPVTETVPPIAEQPQTVPPLTEQAELLPAILTQPKAKWVAQQVKAKGLKKESPGYAAQAAAIGEQYETELDKAFAAAPFEVYTNHPLNKGVPPSALRAGYEALQTQFRFAPKTAAPKISQDEATSHLIDNFGMGVKRLLNTGKLILTTDPNWYAAIYNAQIAQGLTPNVSIEKGSTAHGAVYDGKIYINLLATNKDKLVPTLVHELGEHIGLKGFLGEKEYRGLQDQIRRLSQVKGNPVQVSWNYVAGRYKHLEVGSEKFISEVIARIGETHPDIAWYRRLLAKVKSYLIDRNLGKGFLAGTMTADDLNELLKASARAAMTDKGYAKVYGDTQFSLAERLAPNGKPSNLNAKQYDQVRSKEFKKWFGDWENDAENASKVVDENGEPLVVSHSTDAEFSVFNQTQKNDSGWLGKGAYFFGDRSLDGQYGKNVVEAFLNIREPYYAADEDMETLSEANDDATSAQFTTEKQAEGYDGVYYNGNLNREWVAYEPNQIKSAIGNNGEFSASNDDIRFMFQDDMFAPKTPNLDMSQDEINARMDAAGVARQLRDPVTYDDNGKVILLSERFNPKIEDPRFSLPDEHDEILDATPKEKGYKTKIAEAVSAAATAMRETRMGVATVKQLGELVKHYSPEISTFIENNSQHLALKSRVLSQSARQVTNKWQSLNKADARLINNLVLDSNRVSVHAGRDFFSFTMPYRRFLVDDIAKKYEDQAGFIVGTQVKIPAENLIGTPFENLLSPDSGMFVVESEARARELQPVLEALARAVPVDKVELERRKRWKVNSDRFKTLSQEQQDVYTDSDAFMRALYDKSTAGFVARFREGLVRNSDTEAAIAVYTLQRNAGKVMGYYSPAMRVGRFYFYGVQEPSAGETEGAHLFAMFRTEKALKDFEKTFKGERISSGDMLSRGDKSFESAIGVDDAFMKQMQDAIFEGVSDPTEREALRDEVFMQYLKSLSDVSMRKHNIHREQTAGAEDNAMAAFANYARHGASQLAGITYNDKLRNAIRAAERVVGIFQSGVVVKDGKRVVAKDSIRYKVELELAAAKALLPKLNEDLDALYNELSADDSETGKAMFDMFRKLFSGTQAQIAARLKKIPGTEALVKDMAENPMSTNARLAALTGDDLAIFRQVAADVFDINSAPENVRTRTAAEIKAAVQAIHDSADRAIKTAGHIEKLGVQKTFINVLEELKLSYQSIANSQGGKLDDLVQVLNQATFFMMIGFGTSTALINTLQVGMVAVPIMAGRYKSMDVALVLAKTYKMFFSDLGLRDEDGELSMTPTLKKIIADPNTPVEEREILSDLLNAMTRAKAENDISLSLSHEAARVSNPDFKDTALTSLVSWSGWMMHHAERLNREVTFATAFLLARDPKYQTVYEHQDAATYAGIAKTKLNVAKTEEEKQAQLRDEAFEYARHVNYTAHGDYSTENAARFFRGNIGRTATQFMKYEQQAYWNYGRMAYIKIKGINSPKDVLRLEDFYGVHSDGTRWSHRGDFEEAQQKNNAAIEANDRIAQQEAWRTLSSLMAAQVMAAGAMSLPLIGATMGLLTIAGAAVGGDDDEPWDTEKELQMWLVKLLGKVAAEMFMNGTVNALTPINLASRMDLSNIAFREPLVEKESQDEANYYLARIWGPTGAIATNFVSAWDLAKKGEKERALEKVLPKVVTDMLKSARYSEVVGEGGYRNKRGELVKKMTATEIGLQALGFTSSEINRTMTEMHYIKGEEHALTTARSKIVSDLAEATIAGEPLAYTAVREWNGKHPEFIIKPENVKQSVQSRKTQEKHRDGTSYTVNPKLEHLREKYALTY